MTESSIDGVQYVGTVLMALSSLMGAYYLTLKIREMFTEKPDPKLTYATRTDLERVREGVDVLRRDLSAGREATAERINGGLASAHELIRRNAEHIAVLIAQAEMFERRIAEAVGRIDRISERMGAPNRA
ncbi:MAG: hypothetical protein JW942_05025 [Opitutales bacterium]|nr:hypothetical protein [Opitutales bacterium]